MTLTLKQAKRINMNTFWVVTLVAGVVVWLFFPVSTTAVFGLSLFCGMIVSILVLPFTYWNLKKNGQWQAFKAKMEKENGPIKEDNDSFLNKKIPQYDSAMSARLGYPYFD